MRDTDGCNWCVLDGTPGTLPHQLALLKVDVAACEITPITTSGVAPTNCQNKICMFITCEILYLNII